MVKPHFMSLGRILQLHKWANIVYSNGNVFSSQEAMQEDEVFSIGLEYLDGNVQIGFSPQCICLFLILYIAMLCDSLMDFLLSNTIKNR